MLVFKNLSLQSAKDHFWVRDRERQVRDRSPPLTPADGHHLCFWLRHRPKRAQCARRHRASSPLRGAACCADAFLWLSSRAFCVPAGGRACVVRCVTVYVMSVLITSTVDPSKRYTCHDHVGRLARSSVPAHRKSRRQEELDGERESPKVLTEVSEVRLDAVSSPQV